MFTFYRTFSQISRVPIVVKNSAWNKMKSIATKTNNNLFIFSAKAGGCSGLNYSLEQTTHKELEDIFPKKSKLPKTIVTNEELEIYIDPLSEMYILGTTINFINEDYTKGLYESKFEFIPDSTRAATCGCGISFYLKE